MGFGINIRVEIAGKDDCRACGDCLDSFSDQQSAFSPCLFIVAAVGEESPEPSNSRRLLR